MTDISAENVKAAARYLEDGGLGEVMHMLHMSEDAGIERVASDVPMLLALCAMAQQHLEARAQPVRIKCHRRAA